MNITKMEQTINNNHVFDEIGFDGEYRATTEGFYRSFFESEEQMYKFIISVLQNDDGENTSRRMINQVRRIVTLANDVDKISPGYDPLRILFLNCGLESLIKLSNSKNKNQFYDRFCNCMSQEGTNYILSNFRFWDISRDTKDAENEDEYMYLQYDLTIADFFEIIKQVRNAVVHDGNYWEMQFFARDTEYDWLASKTPKEKVLPNCNKPQNGENATYHLETNMQYEKFIRYFVEGCINFILDYSSNRQTVKKAEEH